MNLNLLILVAYDVLLLWFVLFLIQQGFAFRKKYGYLCELSGLGEKKNKHYKTYNVGYFLFGLFSVPFAFNVLNAIPQGMLSSIGICLLVLAGVSLCLIALYPRDTHQTLHNRFSIILFISIITSFLSLLFPFMESRIIPGYIIVIHGLVALSLLLYSYIKYADIKKFGSNNNRERFVSLWEWIPFMSGLLWNIVVTSVLIMNMAKPTI